MNFEEQKIRYAYNGKPQQWQWGFKSGWNARQGEIDELKAQLECCRRENAVLLGKVGELQGQLNNMEACYIEKKKECEEFLKKADEVLEYLDGESANRWGLWKEKADMLDQGASNAFEEAYWMAKKVLRGEHE